MKSLIASIPRPALILGLGGLLPFFATSVAVIALELNGQPRGNYGQWAMHALGAYGAVILSFLGGVRWGRLLQDDVGIDRWAPVTLSVMPSLIAWLALLLGPTAMLIFLLAGFAFQYAMDKAAVDRHELPGWYGQLRLILTGGALLSLSAALLTLLFG